MKTIHNSCSFEIVRYVDNKAIIEIKPIDGVFTNSENIIYAKESIENLTTNFGGGFEEWVTNNY